MIYISKTFRENIEREENKHYERLCNSLILNGTIDTKYKMFLDGDDIVNIVILSLFKIQDNCKVSKNEVVISKKDGRAINRTSVVFEPDRGHLNNVAKLYDTLHTDIKERIIFSLGLEFIVNIELDETPIFYEVIKSMNAKFMTAQKAAKTLPKQFAKNISK